MLIKVLNALGLINIVAAESSTTPMGDFLDGGTSILGWLLTGLGNIATTVMANPVLSIGFFLLIVHFAVSMFKSIAGSR